MVAFVVPSDSKKILNILYKKKKSNKNIYTKVGVVWHSQTVNPQSLPSNFHLLHGSCCQTK